MSNKLILSLIVIIIFSITVCSATAITLSKSTADLTVYVGKTEIININITNDFNFSIYNLSFSNNSYISYPEIPQLNPKETIQINISITPTSAFEKTKFSSTLSFYYITNTTRPQQTFTVTIKDSSYSPQSITIRKGDTIIWRNEGTVAHTITHTDFDNTIQPNLTYIYQFQTIKSYDYWDKTSGFHGLINVVTIQQEEITYNPDYNKIIDIYLTSLFSETSLELSLDQEKYNLSSGDITEGLLKVTNIGNKTAVNIILEANSNWIFFSENNFNLTKNQVNYVTFTLMPEITSTNQSDKTYNIEISALGDNTDNPKKILEIYIPLTTEIEIGSMDGWWIQKIQFCNLYNTSPLCSSRPIEKIVNRTIYKEPEVPYNYTWRDIDKIKTEIAEIYSTLTRTDNNIKIIQDDLLSLTGFYNQTTDAITQINDRQEEKNISTIIWMIGLFFVTACVCLFLIIIKSKKLGKTLGSIFGKQGGKKE